MSFAQNRIVRDKEGNHFRVISSNDKATRCESVATKEIFRIPTEELTLTELKPR